MKRWTTCCQSNPLGSPLGPESYPNSGGATSVKANFPWECECEVMWDGSGSTLLLHLWTYLVEQYANLQIWPQDLMTWFGQVFESVLNTLLTSEEHRIVQGEAQKEAFGLHTETLGDPARAAGSITVWKADSHWVVNAGESLKREHYRDCILAGVWRGGAKQRRLNEVQKIRQKLNEKSSEFLDRVCKAYWQYRYRS